MTGWMPKTAWYLSNLSELNSERNNLETLAGVEELSKLDMLTADSGHLKTLEGIETITGFSGCITRFLHSAVIIQSP